MEIAFLPINVIYTYIHIMLVIGFSNFISIIC